MNITELSERKAIAAIRSELEEAQHWMARHGEKNALGTARTYKRIAELSARLAQLWQERADAEAEPFGKRCNHKWLTDATGLIDTCSVCGEERA